MVRLTTAIQSCLLLSLTQRSTRWSRRSSMLATCCPATTCTTGWATAPRPGQSSSRWTRWCPLTRPLATTPTGVTSTTALPRWSLMVGSMAGSSAWQPTTQRHIQTTALATGLWRLAGRTTTAAWPCRTCAASTVSQAAGGVVVATRPGRISRCGGIVGHAYRTEWLRSRTETCGHQGIQWHPAGSLYVTQAAGYHNCLYPRRR